MTRMNIELYDRRKRMLELHYSGMQDHKAINVLTEDGWSKKALRQDWLRRKQWEPFIWQMEQSKEDVGKLLFYLHLGRERALGLITTADNANAKVGAIGRLAELVALEIELRQSLGTLPKTADKLEVEDVTQSQNKLIWEELTEEEKNVFRMCAGIRRAHSAKIRSASIH